MQAGLTRSVAPCGSRSFGMAFANVLLPEGRTVELAVREAVAKALTDSEWKEVVVAAVNDLTKNLKAVIRPAN